MPARCVTRILGCLVVTTALFTAAPVHAAVIPLTAADLAGIAPITFAGIPDNTIVNGLVVGGVTFNYLVGSVPSTGAIIDGGPGTTNNIAPPDIVNSTGNAGAVLRLTFNAPRVQLGYGFALLTTGAVPAATTVSLFDASGVLVGSLSGSGAPDPFFSGGFLGLQSTIPFVRADLTFSTAGAAFVADNIRVGSAIPEPASVVLIGMGVLSACIRRRRQS